jgi:DNA-binding transcriptional LysR family regulator
LDIRHVQTLITVLDEGGFAAASRRLGLSRATITERIQALERDVGTPLLVRSPLMLTQAGLAFEGHARRVVDAVTAALDAVANPQQTDHGPLWVGLMAGGAAELNPVLFAALRRAMPACRIVPVALPLAETERALLTGRVDVAILRSPVDDTTLRSVQLFLAPRVALVAERGQFGDAETLRIADMGDIAVTGVSSAHSRTFIDFFSLRPDRNGQALPVELVDTYADAAAVILAERAVAVPSSDAARVLPVPPGLRYVPILDAMPSGAVAACRRHDRRGIVTTFMKVATRVARTSERLVANSITIGQPTG